MLFRSDYAQNTGSVSIPPEIYYHMSPAFAVFCGLLFVFLYLLLLSMILLLFATLGAKKAGVITGFLVIAAGICFCATSSRFKFLFPMANSLLGVHYTRYYREMVFPLSLSAYYFIGLLAVILFVAFIRCKKMNYNFDHEID